MKKSYMHTVRVMALNLSFLIFNTLTTNSSRAQYGVYGFGEQLSGRLGNGQTSGPGLAISSTPIFDGTDGKFVDLSGSNSHSLGIKEDGSLWAWGANTYNQLGDPNLATATPQSRPVQVDDGKDAIHGKWVRVFALNLGSSFAIRDDGSLWAWGDNREKRLGLSGTPPDKVDRPTQVSPGTKWTMVTGGFIDNKFFTIGLKQDSTLWGWGINDQGQLGLNNRIAQSQPAAIAPAQKWIAVSAGGHYVIAINANGSLWGWGQQWGTRGTGGAATLGDYNQGVNHQLIPKQLDPGTDATYGKWTAVSTSFLHTHAIRADGSLWSWGQNTSYGVIGDGWTSTPFAHKRVDDGSNGKWTAVQAGMNYGMGMKENGRIYIWGNPVSGNSNYDSYSPKEITEAGSLNNGRIISALAHGYWINNLPGDCEKTANHIAAQLTVSGATISWVGGGNAVSYEIAIDKTAAQSPSGTAIEVSATSYKAGHLDAGTLYYAHIRTKCAPGVYSEWDTVSFTTLPCLGPLQIKADSVNTGDAVISWDAASSASGYEIVIDQAASPVPSGTAIPLPGTSYKAENLDAGTVYYAHVRTHCGDHNYSDWDTVSFTTLPCSMPGAITAGEITPTAATIRWEHALHASAYEIVIDEHASVIPPGTPLQVLDTLHPASGLNPNTRYYAHIRIHCGGNNYSEWDTVSFITLPECLDPQNLKVTGITSTSAKITWNPFAYALQYDLAIDQSASPEPTVVPRSLTVNSFDATDLEPGETYTVYLRSDCGSGNISAWVITSFTTETPGGIRNTTAADVHIYPNPVRDMLYIHSETPLQIQITDMQGKVVFSGKDVSHVNVSTLPAGLYTVRFRDLSLSGEAKHTRFLKIESK